MQAVEVLFHAMPVDPVHVGWLVVGMLTVDRTHSSRRLDRISFRPIGTSERAYEQQTAAEGVYMCSHASLIRSTMLRNVKLPPPRLQL
jgi:hypothetical protein